MFDAKALRLIEASQSHIESLVVNVRRRNGAAQLSKSIEPLTGISSEVPHNEGRFNPGGQTLTKIIGVGLLSRIQIALLLLRIWLQSVSLDHHAISRLAGFGPPRILNGE